MSNRSTKQSAGIGNRDADHVRLNARRAVEAGRCGRSDFVDVRAAAQIRLPVGEQYHDHGVARLGGLRACVIDSSLHGRRERSQAARRRGSVEGIHDGLRVGGQRCDWHRGTRVVRRVAAVPQPVNPESDAEPVRLRQVHELLHRAFDCVEPSRCCALRLRAGHRGRGVEHHVHVHGLCLSPAPLLAHNHPRPRRPLPRLLRRSR